MLEDQFTEITIQNHKYSYKMSHLIVR